MALKTSLLALTVAALTACASSRQPAEAPDPDDAPETAAQETGAGDDGAADGTRKPKPVKIVFSSRRSDEPRTSDAAGKTEADSKTAAGKTEANSKTAEHDADAAEHTAEATEHDNAPAGNQAEAAHAGLNYLLPEASEGKSQSPINIVTSRAVPRKHKVKFHYRSSKEHVDNLGHTVKVTYDAGSSLEYDGQRYDLVQFHFHTPSEHLLDGVTYPMEMHLVHAQHDHPEHLLVVGVLFKEGQPSSLLKKLIANVPARPGEHTDKDEKLDARSVFKKGEGYYHYEGSLTTPPYSETVTWLVLDQVHDASAEQIEALNRIEGNNARHIQVQNARLIDHWR